MKIIEIRGLNRHFESAEEKFHALKDIDLSVEKGECVILRGVSGSGKTTLLSIVAGLDHPSSGEILVEGEPIAKLPDRHLSRFRGRHIGMIFQHYNLMEHLSARDNVAVPLIPMGLKMEEVRKRVEEAMALANIAHKADQSAGRLSGGEKQRVAIARALAADPQIILCDEPTANLDRANARRFLEILARLHDLGKTILIATHDPIFEELPFEARVVEMENGTIKDRGESAQ
jgi:putative ABC transport system ATP-binding protein